MSTSAGASPASPARAVGSIIAGRYQVESLLGQGGMGDVYLVKHTVMRKRLALKLLRPELSRVAEFSARFEREAMAAANIDHPHVASATDCGKAEDGTLFLALEFVEGRSLREVIAEGPLRLTRALHIAQQVASAMVRAHELGIVHRDLKPENIMLTLREGDPDFVKVLDFGLAKLSSSAATGDKGEAIQKLTQFGEIFGTPQYMAPEQTAGGEADGRTDLYALGMILFEMLAGRLAYDGKAASDFLRHQLATPLPTFAQRAPQVAVPPWVERMVRKLCEKQPDDRYASAAVFLDELEATVEQHQLVLVPARARSSSPSMQNAPAVPLSIGSSQPQAVSGPSAAAPVPIPSKAVPQTASMVMFLGAVGRAQKRMPAPLQRVSPEKLGALAGILGLLVLVGPLLAIWLWRNPSDSPDKPKPRAGKRVARSQPASPARQAPAAGAAPAAADSLRNQALAHVLKGETAAALKAIAELSQKQPAALDEPEIARFLMTQAQSPKDEVASTLLRTIEKDFGERGVDLLLAWSERAPQKQKARYTASLANLRNRSDFSPATIALLDLRLATTCEQKLAVLPRVKASGDARALPQVQALQLTRGCLAFGLADCWECLRSSPLLEETLTALSSRP